MSDHVDVGLKLLLAKLEDCGQLLEEKNRNGIGCLEIELKFRPQLEVFKVMSHENFHETTKIQLSHLLERLTLKLSAIGLADSILN